MDIAQHEHRLNALRDLRKGERFVYHEGRLDLDREKNDLARAMANAAWDLHEQKRAPRAGAYHTTAQERRGDRVAGEGTFRYIAVGL
jgi:hypothetical protein